MFIFWDTCMGAWFSRKPQAVPFFAQALIVFLWVAGNARVKETILAAVLSGPICHGINDNFVSVLHAGLYRHNPQSGIRLEYSTNSKTGFALVLTWPRDGLLFGAYARLKYLRFLWYFARKKRRLRRNK